MSEKGTRNTTIYGTTIMLQWIVAVSRGQEIAQQIAMGVIPVELFYIILLFILQWQAHYYERDTGVLVIDTQQYSFDSLQRQVPAGLMIGLLVAGPLALVGSSRSPPHIFSEFVTQALYVTFVETVFLVVVVRTWTYAIHWKGRVRVVRLGLYAQPLIFGFMHAFVRNAWLAGQFTAESIAGFAYAALFGVFFEALYLARDFLPGSKALYFGAVTVWIVHLVVNTTLIIVKVHAGSLELFPIVVGFSFGVGP